MKIPALGAVALLSVTLVGCAGSADKSAPSTTTTTSSAAAASATPAASGPRYTTQKFSCGGDSYPADYLCQIVVIDPIDPTTDGFKQTVKQVVGELAKDNGGPNFLAGIWDDPDAAQVAIDYINNPNKIPFEDQKAQNPGYEQHNIAIYQGGLQCPSQGAAACIPSSSADAFTLAWFPNAAATAPDAGQWSGSGETWKP